MHLYWKTQDPSGTRNEMITIRVDQRDAIENGYSTRLWHLQSQVAVIGPVLLLDAPRVPARVRPEKEGRM